MLQSFLCSLPPRSPGAPQLPRDQEVAACVVRMGEQEDTGYSLRLSLSCCISQALSSWTFLQGTVKPLFV